MKTFITLLVALGLLVPAFVSAKSAPKDTTPPSVISINIGSSNATPTQAKAGDTVTISFLASEKVTPVVLARTLTLFVKAKNSSGNSWDASYVVGARDSKGRVEYILTLVDAAGNVSICSSIKLPIIKYCPPTGSVTVVATAPPAGDTAAPVIAAHPDVAVTTTETSSAVTYTLPVATDAHDGAVAVSCAPASGSTFALGTTTTTCSATDAAGNTAHTTFAIVLTQVPAPPTGPVPYTIASQPDDTYFCGQTNRSWRFCDDAGTFGLTRDFGSSFTTNLGLGSALGGGALQTVTIARDPITGNIFHPWLIVVKCYTDAAYSQACPDWVTPQSAVSRPDLAALGGAPSNRPDLAALVGRTDAVAEFASHTSDRKYMTANFTDSSRNKNFDGTSPITFNPAYYYQLVIDDTEWEAAAFGSESLLQPYWVIQGIR